MTPASFPYQETWHDTRLSQTQLERFSTDGYLVLPGLLDANVITEVSRWTDEVSNWPETPGRHWMYFEKSILDPGKRILSRMENVEPWHIGFSALCNGILRNICTQLFGEPAVLFKDKINFKLPGGDGFKAHQDAQAGWDRYASLHITALVSIDYCTPENGCLQLVAGKHREGLLGSHWKPLQEYELNYQPVPTEPGDIIYFDSYTPHRSAPNLTQQSRRVLYITWNAASDGDNRQRYYNEKRQNYPQDCEREPGKEYQFRV